MTTVIETFTYEVEDNVFFTSVQDILDRFKTFAALPDFGDSEIVIHESYEDSSD